MHFRCMMDHGIGPKLPTHHLMIDKYIYSFNPFRNIFHFYICQLLAKYWGSIYMVLKQQPLYVVEKYFGYEVAVYFAWLGFYNKMLMYAAIMGVITFTCSILFVNVFNVDEM